MIIYSITLAVNIIIYEHIFNSLYVYDFRVKNSSKLSETPDENICAQNDTLLQK